MTSLIFDVETTGFKNPRIVQLAAILTDGERSSEISLIVNAKHPIDEGAQEVHGISQATVEALGVSELIAVILFDRLLSKAERLVAHNIDFDRGVIQAAYKRLDVDDERLVKIPKLCTMKSLTTWYKLPNKYKRGYKWPKLSEVYKKMFGEELEGAHDAMIDVRATMRVLEEAERLGFNMMAK